MQQQQRRHLKKVKKYWTKSIQNYGKTQNETISKTNDE